MATRGASVVASKGQPAQVMDKKMRPQQAPLVDAIEAPGQRRNKNLRDGDDRPLSVLLNPGAQMMNLHQFQQNHPGFVGKQQQQNSPTGSGSVVSFAQSSPRMERPRSSSVVGAPPNLVPSAAAINGDKKPQTTQGSPLSKAQQSPVQKPPQSTPPSAKIDTPPPPQSMNDAMTQFATAKTNAQKMIRHKMSATSRLINAMADLSVCLLTRAMNEGILEKLELRIYRKAIPLGNGGYAVAEYRNAAAKIEKRDKTGKELKEVDQNAAETDFMVLYSGELLPGEAGKDRDIVENWVKFFDVVKGMSLWWRYCMAVHKRVGWNVKLERSMLNVVDSRVLGFVTIKISNFV